MRTHQKMLLAGGLALAFGLGVALQKVAGPGHTEAIEDIQGLLWPPAALKNEFELRNHRGEVFGRSSLKGRWSLLFFGFTHCPDVCPATIAILDSAYQQLLSAGMTAENLQIVLVSVDPERDTADQLNNYLAYFNKDFVGVTGPHEQLQMLSSEIGALYIAEPKDENGAYSVDHTAAIFVFDPQGRRIGLFSAPHDPGDIRQRLLAIMRKAETS